jgi:hypothetical protein
MWVPLAACVVYGMAIVLGRKYFTGRPAWNLRTALALWNFTLSFFSFMGFIRTFPYLFHNIMTYTWRENFCIDPETHVGSGSTGIWAQLFTLSKLPYVYIFYSVLRLVSFDSISRANKMMILLLPKILNINSELVDTFFIVVHKKPLIFLHWYHHISVLVFTWHAYIHNAPTGIMFCSMNYFVHAIMYFYYFLMAVHCKPKWFKPVWITVAQISQMIVGVTITIMGFYLVFMEKPDNCWLQPKNNWAAFVMYGSVSSGTSVHRLVLRSVC